MTQQEILELIGGAEEWQDIVNEFGNQSKDEIKTELDVMYPDYDNVRLAQNIFDQIGLLTGLISLMGQ